MADHHAPGELEAMPRARRLEYAIEQLSELQQRLHSAQAKVKKLSKVLHLEGADQYEADLSTTSLRSRTQSRQREEKEAEPAEDEAPAGEDDFEEEAEEADPPLEPEQPPEKRPKVESEVPDTENTCDVIDMEAQLEHEELWRTRIADFERIYGWRPSTPPRPPI